MALQSSARGSLDPTDTFVSRHIGPTEHDVRAMLDVLGADSLDTLIAQTVPENIRLQRPLALERLPADRGLSEQEALQMLAQISKKNRIWRSFLGMGYADCHTPTVILRNVLEDPGWYTQYTPYQAEISQGRLEALLNFQTMVTDLTGMELSNASLLDEATAAAEAMQMAQALDTRKRTVFLVADDCHPQSIAVLRTRASARGIALRIVPSDSMLQTISAENTDVFGVLLQYPATDGRIHSYGDLCARAKQADVISVVATDLLALTLLQPPGEFGADIVVGSAQRFGVPMGCGGPHAAFLATHDQYKRLIPGRIIGVSKDSRGKPAYRMALQTREQHIRREKATSNICTAQALLAIMAGMYAVYHGPHGLTAIAQRVQRMALVLAEGLRRMGVEIHNAPFFDTVRITLPDGDSATRVIDAGHTAQMAMRRLDARTLCIALDETSTAADIAALWEIFARTLGKQNLSITPDALANDLSVPANLQAHQRTSSFLNHPVFNQYHAEHDMLRYITRLRNRDLSLAHGMIPLGSCTMKLNATSEMLPVSWPEFARIHPFAPAVQLAGYQEMVDLLAAWLQEITGFAAVSLQPNSGAQGEYAGLMAIRAYHHARGDQHRTICLIPMSAHGTNPASAAMVVMDVVGVACDAQGNVDLADLEIKAAQHADRLAALMVTYPSTHGVFEEGIKRLCTIVHTHGGQVYLDGANMNAQVGVCRPGDIGADVCHINLHKTFCIPHGGGGPGMGPIAVAAHLAPFLPGHPVESAHDMPHKRDAASPPHHDHDQRHGGSVSAAPWGSASILPISWMYIAMMGGAGLRRATQVAILNANYIAQRLQDHYPVLFRGSHGRVAHELIIDIRQFKATSGVQAEDVAKRLMDYGFHAPTMSFPVAGTLMIEPTESESRVELDRLCDALIAIRDEIARVERGEWPKDNNPLCNAPHTMDMVISSAWDRPYTREVAAFPSAESQNNKFWPTVGRIDNVWGDRNLMCTCPMMDEL